MSTSHTPSTRWKQHLAWFVPALALCLFAMPVAAQNNPGGGGFDPAQMRQRMMDRMKEVLGASDDEWQAIGPKLEKVMQLQRDANGGGGMRMLFRRNQGGDQQQQQPQTPVQQKAKELEDAIQGNAPAADIKAKMQALREARAAARQELTKAQDDLKGLLTQKQEATLLMMGMLD
jgi:hypothetical protein